MGEIVSELVSDREPALRDSVLSRLSAIYATASGSEVRATATAVGDKVGDKVGSAASQATEAAKRSQTARDEL